MLALTVKESEYLTFGQYAFSPDKVYRGLVPYVEISELLELTSTNFSTSIYDNPTYLSLNFYKPLQIDLQVTKPTSEVINQVSYKNSLDLCFVISEVVSEVLTPTEVAQEFRFDSYINRYNPNLNPVNSYDFGASTSLSDYSLQLSDRPLSVISFEVNKDITNTDFVLQELSPDWKNPLQQEESGGVMDKSRLDLLTQVTHSKYLKFGSTDPDKIDTMLDTNNNQINKDLTPVETDVGSATRTAKTKSGMSSVVTLHKSVIKSIEDK